MVNPVALIKFYYTLFITDILGFQHSLTNIPYISNKNNAEILINYQFVNNYHEIYCISDIFSVHSNLK